MKLLKSFGTSFLAALVGVLLPMFVLTLLGFHTIKPFIAIGIAAGIGLTGAIRQLKDLPSSVFALLVCLLAMLGSTVGHWRSNG
ncbi:hypothetical protein IHE49_15970 [Rhodanobacter sp. 7MK24]|uniref:hypothetical protein n=1 Tax=Rhodanobacter sp. 7MK24 TaxID=2775922 RepID=UPI0017864B65|nr:hypothetical protein [Rhodanobacter sp. 7MK24]MBD8881982.1 hypothetical protein [Rhodanobacter sp. 7MK24]